MKRLVTTAETPARRQGEGVLQRLHRVGDVFKPLGDFHIAAEPARHDSFASPTLCGINRAEGWWANYTDDSPAKEYPDTDVCAECQRLKEDA